jgi:hypothetical protein
MNRGGRSRDARARIIQAGDSERRKLERASTTTLVRG